MSWRRAVLAVAGLLWSCQGEAPSSSAPQASGASGAGGSAGTSDAGSGGTGAAGTGAGQGSAGEPGASQGGAGGMALATIDVEPLYYPGQQAPFQHFTDGATLLVKRPPQGGFVLWVGADIGGTVAEQVELRVRLRSVATGFLVAEELRSITVEPASGEDGRMHPAPISIRNASNLPVCPNYSDEPILGAPLDLEITVRAPDASPVAEGKVTRRIQMDCPEGSKACACECAPGYTLGSCLDDDTPAPDDP